MTDEPRSADGSDGAGSDVVVSLPEAMRTELKEPLGPVVTDAERLLADAGDPLVAVGDVVTYHLERAGVTPDVALVDGLTKRETVAPEVEAAVSDDARRVTVTNPAGTLTADLLDALVAAVDAPEKTVIAVSGEEDLAALPAVLAVPEGASVVYGQPDEGMVHVRVDEDARAAVRDILSRMDGDPDRLFDVLAD